VAGNDNNNSRLTDNFLQQSTGHPLGGDHHFLTDKEGNMLWRTKGPTTPEAENTLTELIIDWWLETEEL
jgi:hypothetical protein